MVRRNNPGALDLPTAMVGPLPVDGQQSEEHQDDDHQLEATGRGAGGTGRACRSSG